MRTTIKDVAKAVGISTTAVSLVLNNKPNRIKTSTKEAVLKAAKDLNYRPNHIAVSMVTKKTHTIGLILPDISNLYFSELAKIIESECLEYGYNVLYGNTNNSINKDFEYLNIFMDRNVDAIIMVLSTYLNDKENKIFYDIVSKNGVPIILVDRAIDDKRFKSVVLNQKLGGYIATDFLTKLGHKRIACITGPGSIQLTIERLNGYRSALENSGIPYDKSLVYEGDFCVDSGAKALPYLLGQNATAVFCQNDMMAIGIYRECRRYNLSIPKDFNIVGFDDIFIDEFLDPPLTTIAQPVVDIGTQAVKQVMSALAEVPSNIPNMIVFNPILKARGSTCKLR